MKFLLYLKRLPESAWSASVLAKLKRESIRFIVQAFAAAFSNGYVKGFAEGRIFQGTSKSVCVPGLNCYSCPGALGACPIGSLQAVIGSRNFNLSLYVLGLLTLFGIVFGRFVCGFLCPFGFIQDLLNKIPLFKKIRRLPGEKFLSKIRFLILAVFVIILPLVFVDVTGLGEPWFCKYICPAGTLEGGIPLVLLNPSMREAAGFLFRWKFFILAVVLSLSAVIYRPFCRYICPLGAFYSFFNKFAVYRIKVDQEKCVKCDVCRNSCGFDIKVYEKPDAGECIRCGKCASACPSQAIQIGFFASSKPFSKLQGSES